MSSKKETKSIIDQAVSQWIDTWKTNKFLFFLELFGTLTGIVCAITINIYAINPPMMFILSGYFVSAVLLSKASYIRQSPFMFLLMTFYAITSFYGIIALII